MQRTDSERLRAALERGITTATRSSLVELGWAESTATLYAKEYGRFEGWCRPPLGPDGEAPERWLAPMPATPETLALWVYDLAQQGLAPATIRKKIDAVKAWHRRHGHPTPDGLPALGVLREHERILARGGFEQRRAAALRVEDLVRILLTLDRTTARGICDAAIVLAAFAGCMREQELCDVNIGDVTEVAEGVRVRIAIDKTTRHTGPGKGVSVPHWASEQGDHHPALCPACALLAWSAYLIGRGAHRGSPLIRFVDQHNRVSGVDENTLGTQRLDARMQTRGLRTAFRRLVVQAAIPNGAAYSFHSLRVGGATEMRLRGATLEDIADHGRWSRNSSIVIHYIRVAEEWLNNPMSHVGQYAINEHLARYLSAMDRGPADG